MPLRAGRREWTAFVVLLLPLLLVSMDISVLYFALPAISEELEPSAVQQLWIFDAYGFTLSGLLLTMGVLGDRIGRRRLLLVGAAAFGIASLWAAHADSTASLIAARVALGAGGATLMPSTLALMRDLFLDAGQRSRAIGIWSGVMAGGVAVGSVVSGVMLSHFWWGSVFLVNVPAMVLLLVLVPVLVPESPGAPGSKEGDTDRFDVWSVPLSVLAVVPAVYGVKELAAGGPHTVPLICLAVGAGAGWAFVRRQRSRDDAMVSRALLRARGFGAGIALNTTAAFAMMGSAYFITQYLQSVLGYSPLRAALWSLAPALAVGVAAPASAWAGRRLGRTRVVSCGFLVMACGFALIALTGTGARGQLLAGAAVMGCGMVAVVSQVCDLALAAVPQRRAGAAASLLEAGQELGGALGMALLGSVGTAVYRHDLTGAVPAWLPPAGAEATQGTLGGADAVASRLPGGSGDELLAAAREAFVHGMQTAAWCGVVLLVASAALTVKLLSVRHPGRVTSPGPASVSGRVPSGPPVAGAVPGPARSARHPHPTARTAEPAVGASDPGA